jgi:outer membrane protein OmpA-like peptidoglycan-associated protein
MRKLTIAVLPFVLAVPVGSVQAQSIGSALKNTVERAAKEEVQRKADEETRRVTRCALGDEKCQSNGDSSVADKSQTTKQTGLTSSFAIVPYQGSVLREESVDAFNEYVRIVGFRKGPVTQPLEGRLSRQKYDNPKGRSTLEIARNYDEVLKNLGFNIDFTCAKRAECGNPAKAPSWNSINGINLGVAGDIRYLTGHFSRNGRSVYVAVAINPQIHYIHTLEAQAMQAGMVSATALADSLDRDGRVELRGVYFDSGNSVLRSESHATIAEIAQLMNARPTIRLAVVGHTDNTGKVDANIRLSDSRANAVRDTLIARYGIAASRLIARGKGSAEPVASNDTPEGRAQNRRVELVRQ